MRLNLPAVLLIMGGALLMYSARTNRDPRNVVFETLNLKRRVPDPEPPKGTIHGNLYGRKKPASTVPDTGTRPVPGSGWVSV